MKQKLTLVLISLSVAAMVTFGTENSQAEVFSNVSNELHKLKQAAGSLHVRALSELASFEFGFAQKPYYKAFSESVTNDWRCIVTNINLISTNYIDRLLILGTGKQGDEALFLAYLETLADMRIKNEIPEIELMDFVWPGRDDLNSVLIRRYREPAISNLVETMKIALPRFTNHWDSVLSGERYIRYVDEHTDKPRRGN